MFSDVPSCVANDGRDIFIRSVRSRLRVPQEVCESVPDREDGEPDCSGTHGVGRERDASSTFASRENGVLLGRSLFEVAVDCFDA